MSEHRSKYHKAKVEERLENLNEMGLDGHPIYREKESIRVRAYMKVCDLKILLTHCIEKDVSPTSFINSAVLAKLDSENK